MKVVKDKISYGKKIIHKDLAAGRWFLLSFVEQFANVGSDVERTIQWKKRGNEFSFTDEYWQQYFFDFAYAAAIARGR